jgi:hypothetical protein
VERFKQIGPVSGPSRGHASYVLAATTDINTVSDRLGHVSAATEAVPADTDKSSVRRDSSALMSRGVTSNTN